MIKIIIKDKTVEVTLVNGYDLIKRGGVPADKESRDLLLKVSDSLEKSARVEIPECTKKPKKTKKTEGEK